MTTRNVSIHSYRGGTGKSNVTANLAAELARRGARVAIVDTDIQSPGIHALFQVDPRTLRYTLNDYLWGRCEAMEAAVDVSDRVFGAAEAGAAEEAGAEEAGAEGAAEAEAGEGARGAVFLVPSSLRTGEIARILKEGYDVSALNDGFRSLGEGLGLDYLMIDTHPGVNEETLLSIAISDVLFIVLRPDVQDYQGTAVTLELARRLEVPELFLVVNKALSSLDFQDLSARVFTTYRAPVATVLPLSEEVIELGSNGLIALIRPDGTFAEGIRVLADRVEGKEIGF